MAVPNEMTTPVTPLASQSRACRSRRDARDHGETNERCGDDAGEQRRVLDPSAQIMRGSRTASGDAPSCSR